MRVALIDDLVRELEAVRAEFLAALDGITQEQFVRRPPGEVGEGEERWPVRDVCWHLGQYDDFQRRVILAGSEGRAVPPNQPTRRPAHLNTPDLLREWLSQSRRALIVLASHLDEDALNREFEGSNGRALTARGILKWIAIHERSHIAQVVSLRAQPPAEER
jgi:hypothetical protein